MKTYGRLFDNIFTEERMLAAFREASRSKKKTGPCFDYERNLGRNIAWDLDRIHAGTYRPDPYFTFSITDPKPRVIHAPAFRDRVVQHAIYREAYPLFDRQFIDASFACRVGYGTHRASLALQKSMQQCSPEDYYLQLDVRKFFYSIDRQRLRRMVEDTIREERLVEIMMMFADASTGVGIPIGNLLCQLYALIYLNPLDHYIKRQLKIKHYVRYVDDFVLVGLGRDECFSAREEIVKFLRDELALELSRTTIQRIGKGVNFVGYRTWRDKRLVRKHSLYKFNRSVRLGDEASVISLLGHAKDTATLPHFIKTIKEHGYGNLQLPARVRRAHNLSA